MEPRTGLVGERARHERHGEPVAPSDTPQHVFGVHYRVGERNRSEEADVELVLTRTVLRMHGRDRHAAVGERRCRAQHDLGTTAVEIGVIASTVDRFTRGIEQVELELGAHLHLARKLRKTVDGEDERGARVDRPRRAVCVDDRTPHFARARRRARRPSPGRAATACRTRAPAPGLRARTRRTGCRRQPRRRTQRPARPASRSGRTRRRSCTRTTG